MHIVADKSIPFISNYFMGMGNLVQIDGSEINRAHLVNADIVIVRTVTRVNRELLYGTRVRYVASATSGHDHIDTDYLMRNNIGFVHAPGCNARSVAEYVISSLFVLADQKQFSLVEKSIAIVGYGNVGSQVYSFIRALGMECLVYDPPLQESGVAFDFATLEEVLKADIITLHIPLEKGGPYPSAGLVGRDFLSRLKSDVILINTSRGDVVDETELTRFIDSKPGSAVVLDVWKNEPFIDVGLIGRSFL